MNLREHKTKINNTNEQKAILNGAKELYSFVYKRIWDLTQYDTTVLKRYGLHRAMYIYIGSSNKYNLRKRNTDWKIDILNNRNVAKSTREFIFNLKNFYEQETNYTDKEIDYLLYYNADVIARCESREGAYKLEKHLNSNYHYLDSLGEILEQRTILLSKIDSSLKEVKEEGVKMLKYK